MRRPSVGCVLDSARAAADRLPASIAARKDRTRSQSKSSGMTVTECSSKSYVSYASVIVPSRGERADNCPTIPKAIHESMP